jgi:hypothetical protein
LRPFQLQDNELFSSLNPNLWVLASWREILGRLGVRFSGAGIGAGAQL